MCVCVCEREREGETVCVCERERERERGREPEDSNRLFLRGEISRVVYCSKRLHQNDSRDLLWRLWNIAPAIKAHQRPIHLPSGADNDRPGPSGLVGRSSIGRHLRGPTTHDVRGDSETGIYRLLHSMARPSVCRRHCWPRLPREHARFTPLHHGPPVVCHIRPGQWCLHIK